jgi:hypothetical protein
MLIVFLLTGGRCSQALFYLALPVTTLMLPIGIGYGGRRCNLRHRLSSNDAQILLIGQHRHPWVHSEENMNV